MDLGVEERKLAVEIIATLAHIKRALAAFILQPAGIPSDVYQPMFSRRDETTGKVLSKRQLAPFIIDAIEKRSDCHGSLRRIIEIAANWSSFHLADDEYAARATVQKAREMVGTLQTMDEREAKQRDLARMEELSRMDRERADMVRKQSHLLLLMFDDMAKSTDPQHRGYLLQDLLNRVFDLHQILLIRPYTRNASGEQIDGAFKIEGWHYLLECRWRKELADIRELDGLKGQIDRSGKQAMGLFLSINGWSRHVPGLLKQNPEKSIVLMDGYDLRTVLSNHVDLRDFVLAKIAKLNLDAEPFHGVKAYLNDQRAG